MTRRPSIASFVLAVAVSLSSVSNAQSPGDANQDGRVDADDATAFVSCMSGPGSAATSSCSEVFPNDGDISLDEWIFMMQAATRFKPGCTLWPVIMDDQDARGHACLGLPYVQGLHGVGATIDSTPAPALCSTPGQTAFSLAWADVAGLTFAPQSSWLQTGLAVQRSWLPNTPIFNTTRYVYSEVKIPDDPEARLAVYPFEGFPTPSARVIVDWDADFAVPPGTGTAYFYVSGTPNAWDQFNPPGGYYAAIHAGWCGETLNAQDLMWGSVSNPCTFSELVWSPGDRFNYQTIIHTPDDYMNVAPYLFGMDIVADDAFEVWDWLVP